MTDQFTLADLEAALAVPEALRSTCNCIFAQVAKRISSKKQAVGFVTFVGPNYKTVQIKDGFLTTSPTYNAIKHYNRGAMSHGYTQAERDEEMAALRAMLPITFEYEEVK